MSNINKDFSDKLELLKEYIYKTTNSENNTIDQLMITLIESNIDQETKKLISNIIQTTIIEQKETKNNVQTIINKLIDILQSNNVDRATLDKLIEHKIELLEKTKIPLVLKWGIGMAIAIVTIIILWAIFNLDPKAAKSAVDSFKDISDNIKSIGN